MYQTFMGWIGTMLRTPVLYSFVLALIACTSIAPRSEAQSTTPNIGDIVQRMQKAETAVRNLDAPHTVTPAL